MPKYNLTYSEDAKRGFAKFKKSGEKQALQKLRVLLEELESHPCTGTGKPERLKGHDKHDVWRAGLQTSTILFMKHRKML